MNPATRMKRNGRIERKKPPGNMNAFKHGLAAIQKRREDGVPTERDENVRKSNPGRIDSRPATRYPVMLCGADIMKTFGKRHTPG